MKPSSPNLLIFARALPLMDESYPQYFEDALYHFDFKKKITQIINRQQMNINLSFDILDNKFYETTGTIQAQILYLTSSVYDPEYLCIENDGKVQRIDSKIQKRFDNIQMLILAMPQSLRIGEQFRINGIHHVVCFQFQQESGLSEVQKYDMI